MRRIKLRGILLYGAIAVPFLLIAKGLEALGLGFETGLSIALLVGIAVGLYATWKVRTWYRETTPPRSIFYSMLVSALEVKVAFGAWIGYLVAASLLARPEVGITLPLPPQQVRQGITGVAAIGLMIAAVYYAVTILLERRGGVS